MMYVLQALQYRRRQDRLFHDRVQLRQDNLSRKSRV